MPVAVSNAEDLGAAPQVSVTPDTAPAGLETDDLVVGQGTEATTRSTVTVQYLGVHIHDGTEFDSSWSRGSRPVAFPLGQVIAGFRDGIAGMREGGRRVLVVPSDMGYGAQGAPPAIGPNEPLVFVVDLVSVG